MMNEHLAKILIQIYENNFWIIIAMLIGALIIYAGFIASGIVLAVSAKKLNNTAFMVIGIICAICVVIPYIAFIARITLFVSWIVYNIINEAEWIHFIMLNIITPVLGMIIIFSSYIFILI